MTLTIPGNPLPKKRPRFVRGRVYSPSSKEEKRVAQHLSAQMGVRKPLTGRLSVTMTFYRKDRRRVDLDNLEKLAADSANGVLWEDDSQIVEMISRKDYDPKQPRTEIEIREA